jgi:uncharacterized membrane protein
VQEVLEAVPEPKREAAARVLIEYKQSFSGPLPHPSLLKQYNDCVPDGAERIIKMAENQSDHRRSLERMVVESNCRGDRIGQICGVSLAGLALVGAIVLMALGQSGPGITVMLTDAVGLGGAFIYSRKVQAEERSGKAATVKALAPKSNGEQN